MWKIIISFSNGEVLDTVDNATDGRILHPCKEYKYYLFVLDGKINFVKDATLIEASHDEEGNFLTRLMVPDGTEKIQMIDGYRYAVPLKIRKRKTSAKPRYKS